jgi:hypothetical protein
MNREALIEAMARALCEAQQPSGAWDRNRDDGGAYHNIFRHEAEAVLAAIEAAGAVIVPRDATAKQIDEMASSIRGAGFSGDSYLLARVVWNVALRASIKPT